MGDFLMPSLGADMDDGTILEWRIRAGDTVRRGDIVAVVDTDKADIDVEVFEDGVVEELLVAPGVRVPVGTPLARLRALDTARPARPAVRASPRARRLATARGVDLSAVSGSGPRGAVTGDDVEVAAGVTEPTPERPGRDRVEAMRASTAQVMARSKREIPHYYLARTIDLDRATSWLAAANEERAVDQRLLPVALLLKATALAAREVQDLNGFWEDGLQRATSVHLGVAVSVRGGGLIAPSIPDADRMDLTELMVATRGLVERARSGRLRSSEMTGATLTVTSLGDQGADEVYGVIHPPQLALVGFGRIHAEPRAVDGMLAVRPVVRATLAADHRATDGHVGSRFLAAIDRLLQTPEDL